MGAVRLQVATRASGAIEQGCILEVLIPAPSSAIQDGVVITAWESLGEQADGPLIVAAQTIDLG